MSRFDVRRTTITGWLRLGAAAFAGGALIGLPIAAVADTISLFELARFDLSTTSNGANPEFIGSNPIAVGWNGTKLYVAGNNGGGTTVNTGVIEVTNAANVTNGSQLTGLVTPTYSTVFGALSSPTTQGYRGLSMNGNRLAAAFDPGSNSASGIQLFDASTNTLSWNLSASGTNASNVGITRGMAGPDFDPGYLGNSGSGSGLGWTTQGVGRRLLNDATSGATAYSATANVPTGAVQGMVINTSPISTNWRDMAFDPATGDLYMRGNNNVTRANRTAANANANPVTSTANQSAVIVSLTAANNVGTNIGYMNSVLAGGFNAFQNTYAGDLLVFNDRASSASGQSWTNVIKFTSTSGSAVTANYTFISTPLTSVGAYDFEWDAGTQTLAVLDYSNRNVSIFAVPEPSATAVAAVSSAGLVALMLRRRRNEE